MHKKNEIVKAIVGTKIWREPISTLEISFQFHYDIRPWLPEVFAAAACDLKILVVLVWRLLEIEISGSAVMNKVHVDTFV